MNTRELKQFLDYKSDEYNRPEFISSDPVQIPHRFSKKRIGQGLNQNRRLLPEEWFENISEERLLPKAMRPFPCPSSQVVFFNNTKRERMSRNAIEMV